MEETERIDYAELVATVKKLEKNTMAREVSVKIQIDGRAIEFSPKSIITKSYRDMLNEIAKIEKIIAAVQYDMELMSTMQQEQQVEEAQPLSEEQPTEITPQQETAGPVDQVEGQQPPEEVKPPEEARGAEEERDNNKIVKKKKRDKRRESDE